jgi:hypothetical protein
MSRYFFPCTGGATYDVDGDYDTEHQEYYYEGYSDFSGNRTAIMFFNAPLIRSTLTGQRVTACAITLDVEQFGHSGETATLVFGTHNYVTIPSSLNWSRINDNRVQRPDTLRGVVTQFPLGVTIGTELRDGVTTGIALGPGPDDDDVYHAGIVIDGEDTEPVLVIDAVLINVAPTVPTLVLPANNTVIDSTHNAIAVKWTANDPNGDVQAAWYFRRTKTDGSFDWWNGTTFVSTETRLTQSTAPLTAGTMTIPAGKWATGIHYAWSVATEDPSGLVGPYSSTRTLYTSLPPTVTVTAPATPTSVAQPTITWTFADPDGDAQYGWQALIVESSVYSASGYNPSTSTGQAWSGSGLGAATFAVQTNVNLKNHKTYRAYVQVTSSPNPVGGTQLSPWAFIQFDVVILPYAPIIVYPTNGSNVDLAAGFTFSWTASYYQSIGSQTGFAIRRNVGAGAYQWWNGTTWGSVEVFLSGANTSYAFRTNEIANGSTYTFAVAVRDDFSQQSPYSTGVTVIGSAAAQVTVLSPLGSSAINNPIVTWSIFQPQNYAQQTWQIRVLASATYTGLTIDPLTATAVWDSGEVTSGATRTASIGVNLLNAKEYRAYVRVKTFGVYSGWAYAQFVISLVPPATPAAYTIVRDDLGAIDIIVQGRDSILSEDASRNATGWQGVTNCTIVNSIFYGSSQSQLISNLTASASGTMTANTSTAYSVAPGIQYTAAVTLLAGVGEASVNGYVSIEFYTVSSVFISVFSASVLDDASAIRSSVTAVAPVNAALARIRVTYQNVVLAGDIHGFFDPVLRPGTGTEWTPGGTLGLTTISVIEGNNDRPLRRGQDLALSSLTQQLTIRDEEPSMGSPMIYLVYTRVTRPTATLVSPYLVLDGVSWTSGWLWLSDPLRYGSGRAFGPQSFAAILRPIRQGKFRPIGRPDAVITTGVRGLREGSYTIIAANRDDREAHLDLIVNSEVILLRVPPDQGDTEGETIYIRPEGDSPEMRLTEGRTTYRGITQNWTEQRRPLTAISYGDDA